MAKSCGVVIIWCPPHTSQVMQGEDVICFCMFKGMLRKAMPKVIRLKAFLIAPYKDALAWAGKTAQLGCLGLLNSDLMFCICNVWIANVTGLVPFTQ